MVRLRWNIFFERGVYKSTVVPFGMNLPGPSATGLRRRGGLGP
jgi:hypothetical protein